MSTEHHRWRLDADVWADLYITGPMTPLAAERLIEYLALITTPDMTVKAGVTEEALADFGLVFGVTNAWGFRHAVASDGDRYEVRKDDEYDVWRWRCTSGNGTCATEAEAIAKARTHDEQRRGGR